MDKLFPHKVDYYGYAWTGRQLWGSMHNTYTLPFL